jgi:hypothetical protein
LEIEQQTKHSFVFPPYLQLFFAVITTFPSNFERNFAKSTFWRAQNLCELIARQIVVKWRNTASDTKPCQFFFFSKKKQQKDFFLNHHVNIHGIETWTTRQCRLPETQTRILGKKLCFRRRQPLA